MTAEFILHRSLPVLLDPVGAPVYHVHLNVLYKLGRLMSQLGSQSGVICTPDQQRWDLQLLGILHHSASS